MKAKHSEVFQNWTLLWFRILLKKLMIYIAIQSALRVSRSGTAADLQKISHFQTCVCGHIKLQFAWKLSDVLRPELTYLLLVFCVSGALSFLRWSFRHSAADKKLIESHHGISLWQISNGNGESDYSCESERDILQRNRDVWVRRRRICRGGTRVEWTPGDSDFLLF